jgi:hypothetical protein
MSVLECTDGIVDVTGTCCLGRINRNGTCCAPGDTVDGAGACCTGSVDVCGVCNGTAVAVDVYGDCCAAPLTAAGICCDDGRAVDDCGVCSGTNECLLNIAVGAMVNASTALALSNTSSAQYEALRLQLATLVSQAMRVSLSAVAGLALSLADDSGRRLVRRSDASRVPCVLAWSHPFMRRRCICACACSDRRRQHLIDSERVRVADVQRAAGCSRQPGAGAVQPRELGDTALWRHVNGARPRSSHEIARCVWRRRRRNAASAA